MSIEYCFVNIGNYPDFHTGELQPPDSGLQTAGQKLSEHVRNFFTLLSSFVVSSKQ